ncbi:type II toxin-antitoxin system YafQ family toxin [Photorhabdus stackebrandtii]|uniref:Type II toxin-antitoxin system YafQ family toxin n=1 Tax=Photorhabdus stackebrandtii TaxID=1123042 RepID=A0A7X5QPI1_9GAMM|nr:type II toxin-antitoxin system YafQ family toxin [Photorhabdus stackebrandtii]NHB98151.1 type II toxin-antitoxin system YafQ family toxin [Photorhabdus stackebrandtii]
MINNKRSKLPRRIEYTRTFAKSWERYNRGRRNMNDMIEVMKLIFSDKELPEKYLDHELKGAEWEGARELHVGGDFILKFQ